ncbi:MAG: hypothetical protein K2K10_02895 [Acetatifactor sp.]|nr:hypothetical protein [Acetatifactor sp.]
MMKRTAVLVILMMCFLAGCSAVRKPELLSGNESAMQESEIASGEVQDIDEERVASDEFFVDEWYEKARDHTNLDGTHISIDRTTRCTREEYPDLYADMEVLLSKHLELWAELNSAEYGKPDWKESIIREGNEYYLLTEKSSLQEVWEELGQVYTDEYIDRWITPFILHPSAPKFWEEDGNLYGVNADGVSFGLEDDWTIFKATDTCYYVQAYKDLSLVGGDTLSIFTVIRTDAGLCISDIVEISF